MEGNTCAIQAQVKDVMLDSLDCLVKGFTVYIKSENKLITLNQLPFITLSNYPLIMLWLMNQQEVNSTL